MKQSTRLFLASFVMTLIFIFGMLGFFTVELSKQNYGPAIAPFSAAPTENSLVYDVSFGGTAYSLSLAPFNEIAYYSKKYGVVLIPRDVRLFSQLAFFGKQQYDEYYEKYLEREYMESISR